MKVISILPGYLLPRHALLFKTKTYFFLRSVLGSQQNCEESMEISHTGIPWRYHGFSFRPPQ